MKYPGPLLFLTCLFLSGAPLSADIIISEVVTENTKFDDEDTDSPDWLELYNTGTTEVDLHGWHLTVHQDHQNPWQIQNFRLAPGQARILFASGKDRSASPTDSDTARPHTSFSLENDGGYVALLRPDLTAAASLTYPALEKNVAYGIKGGQEGYLFPASPAAPNNTAPAPNGLAPSVSFSHEGGIIDGAITLTLEVPGHPEADIQYAFDGAEPSIFTPGYKGPIVVDKSTTIRARALLPNHLPSRIEGRGFLLLDESLTSYEETGATFESNLPVLTIDSFGANVDATRNFVPAYIAVTTPHEDTGRAVLGGPAEFNGFCGIHLRGESSSGFGQKSYALEIQDEDGEDHDVSLLGMPAESDWVLYGPWSEKTLMRNKLIYDWMRQLRGDDGTSVRTAFCELFLNQRTSETVGENSYQGVYLLIEKIKGGRDRVPVEGLNEYTVAEDLITGGYIIRKDKTDSGKNSWTTSGYSQPLQSFDPDRFNDVQLAYVRSYINNFETALRGDSFDHPVRGYAKYIDPDTFIDAQWFVEIAKQVDGYVFSTYWHKPRHGKLRAGPLWDFNISLGNADYATGDRSKGWLYDNSGGRGQIWYPRLHADPEYHMAHWDRYWHMRQRIFSDDAIDAVIDSHMHTLLDGYDGPVGNRADVTIQNPVARHFRKYPFLGNRQWPNPPAETSIKTWQEEVEYMRDWIKERLDWIDDQSMTVGNKVYRAPRLSRAPGAVEDPFSLEIIPHKGGLFDGGKYPTETIYYTVDGSDPRLPGGELNPSAQAYQGPIALEETTTVQARILNADQWSPKTTGTYLLNHAPASSENLMVTEIMYHPAPPSGLETFNGLRDANLFEYLELTNVGTKIIDLSGVHFTRGIQFEFSSLPAKDRLIAPGESILLANHLEGFQRRYSADAVARLRGLFTGRLSNDGERITLANAAGEEIVDLEFNDGEEWPAEADGGGHSLVWTGTAGADPKAPASWHASLEPLGTPGTHTLDPGSTPNPQTDTDSDGLTDVLERALGSDPADPASFFLPRLSAETPDTYQLTQRHRAELDAGNLSLESSTDLITWQPLSGISPQILETHADGTVTHAWTLTATGENGRYLRVAVTLP